MEATARPNTPYAPDASPQQVSHQLRHMVDEIDTYLKSAADSGDQKIAAARDRLTAQIRELRSQVDELNQATAASMRRVAERADQTVHSHPYGAMGAAAAAGLIIGFLASRR